MEYKGQKLRHELKFFINEYEYTYLRNRFRDTMNGDTNGDENNSYHIRSLYFDDMYNSAFRDKESGVFIRKKYRIRIYNFQDKIIKLERKNKFDRYINKDSTSLIREDVYKILKEDYTFLQEKNNKLARDFYVETATKILRPRIIVDYNREAYICKEGNVRITFDKNLRAGINSFDIFDNKMVTKKVFQEPIMILEVKYDSYIPSHVKNLIQICSHNMSAASKYILCTNVIKNLKY